MLDLRLITIACLAVVWLSGVDAACKIQYRIFSDTAKKFKISFFNMALQQKTGKLYFAGKGARQDITFEGPTCIRWNEPLVVKTWTAVGGSPAEEQFDVPAKEVRGYYEGNGYVDVHVEDDLLPSFRNRKNVACMMGFCW